MRRVMVLLLSLVLTLAFLVPAALAGRCAETGDCGTGGRGGGGGGGGYVQRDSGLWVPNRDGYIQQRSAPVAYPELGRFGQDVVRDAAKDVVKLTALGLLSTTWDSIVGAFDGMTDEERSALPMMPIK